MLPNFGHFLSRQTGFAPAIWYEVRYREGWLDVICGLGISEESRSITELDFEGSWILPGFLAIPPGRSLTCYIDMRRPPFPVVLPSIINPATLWFLTSYFVLDTGEQGLSSISPHEVPSVGRNSSCSLFSGLRYG